jgi:hypothetical protein
VKRLLEKIFPTTRETSTTPPKFAVFSISDTEKSLDISKENIETILTYLETYAPHLIKLLPSKNLVGPTWNPRNDFILFLT